jgi:hypothetical protein
MQMAHWTFGYKLRHPIQKKPMPIGSLFKRAHRFYSMHAFIGLTTGH